MPTPKLTLGANIYFDDFHGSVIVNTLLAKTQTSWRQLTCLPSFLMTLLPMTAGRVLAVDRPTNAPIPSAGAGGALAA